MNLPYLQKYLFYGLSVKIGSTSMDDFQVLDKALSASSQKTDRPPDWEFYSLRKPICLLPDLNSHATASIDKKCHCEGRSNLRARASSEEFEPYIKTETYQFWQDDEILWIQFEKRAMIRYDRVRQICYVFSMPDQNWDASSFIHHIFYVALIQRTAELDWVAVHGAAVSRNGAGILILAPSGGGKSTLALSLGLAGFSVLSDDRVILRLDDNRSELISLLEPIRVSPHSLPFFPKKIPPIKRESNTACHILLIPKIVDESHPSLVPISTMEGMRTILNQSTIRLLPKKLFGRKLKHLIDWLDGVDCYRLNLTPKLDHVNALVTDLTQNMTYEKT